MEIVIEVSDTLMEYIVKGRDLSEEQNDEMALAVANGKPLPKGHGDLIDRNEISIPYDICDGDEAMDYVNEVSAIVEADKLPNNELENPFNDSRFGG